MEFLRGKSFHTQIAFELRMVLIAGSVLVVEVFDLCFGHIEVRPMQPARRPTFLHCEPPICSLEGMFCGSATVPSRDTRSSPCCVEPALERLNDIKNEGGDWILSTHLPSRQVLRDKAASRSPSQPSCIGSSSRSKRLTSYWPQNSLICSEFPEQISQILFRNQVRIAR